MTSYSQCPGECYSEFWEDVDNDNHHKINIEEFTKGKRYDKDSNEWVEVTTQYRIDYYKKGDLERRWKYYKTMPMAIAKAYEMIQTEKYTIEAINPDV